ncbi:MAG: R3H domain-containing nucleic acid-binding protein [Candidatus Bipolaricaulota bacterium]
MEKTRETEQAHRFVSGLLDVLDEKASVEISPVKGELYVNLKGNLHRLGEQQGLLASLTHLLRCHLRVTLQSDLPVSVDVNGVLAARREELAARARKAAQQVANSGNKHRLPPMSARDRRLVHMALADFTGVRTRSVGQGSARRVVIEPLK